MGRHSETGGAAEDQALDGIVAFGGLGQLRTGDGRWTQVRRGEKGAGRQFEQRQNERSVLQEQEGGLRRVDDLSETPVCCRH